MLSLLKEYLTDVNVSFLIEEYTKSFKFKRNKTMLIEQYNTKMNLTQIVCMLNSQNILLVYSNVSANKSLIQFNHEPYTEFDGIASVWSISPTKIIICKRFWLSNSMYYYDFKTMKKYVAISTTEEFHPRELVVLSPNTFQTLASEGNSIISCKFTIQEDGILLIRGKWEEIIKYDTYIMKIRGEVNGQKLQYLWVYSDSNMMINKYSYNTDSQKWDTTLSLQVGGVNFFKPIYGHIWFVRERKTKLETTDYILYQCHGLTGECLFKQTVSSFFIADWSSKTRHLIVINNRIMDSVVKYPPPDNKKIQQHQIWKIDHERNNLLDLLFNSSPGDIAKSMIKTAYEGEGYKVENVKLSRETSNNNKIANIDISHKYTINWYI